MSKIILIDVRTAGEFANSHKEGAVNIPVGDIMSGRFGVLSDCSKDTEIKLYCLSGSRAELAKDILESLGYMNVTNIGGFRG